MTDRRKDIHQGTAGAVPEAPDAAGDRRRVLLCIEDNPTNLELVRRVLARREHIEVLSAANAEAGLGMARKARPDAVLVDIHLPDMDGFEVLRRLRSFDETRETPVLAFSGDTLPHDVQRGLDAGFFRYLTKPTDIATLLQAVDDAVSRATD